MQNCEILGILNLTKDSFSDGGKYIESKNAILQAKYLVQSGAGIIDLGAQSSNPDAEPVPEEIEWLRLEKLIQTIQKDFPVGQQISIDSFRPGVLRKAIEYKIDFWNDITALRSDECLEILQSSDYIPNIILMYSHSQTDKAIKDSHLKPESIMDTICTFFEAKRNILVSKGIPEDKLIFDPGMGFFLGADANLSFSVLREINRFKKEFSKVLISVSRKSFLTAAIGNIPPMDRSAATLAAEMYCYQNGVDFIRTHNPLQLKQAMKVSEFIHHKKNG